MHCRITGKGRAAGDAALRGAEGELIVTGHTDEVVGRKEVDYGSRLSLSFNQSRIHLRVAPIKRSRVSG
jgi:hypothetical protein